MHHAEADELGLFKSGDEPKHTRLLAPFDLRLESDQAEMIGRQIVLSKLHDRVRRPTGPRIDEANRFHRAETQRVHAAMRHDLDRQAPFEELFLVEIMDGRGFGVGERVVEALVLLARQRTIQVVALAVVDAAGWPEFAARLPALQLAHRLRDRPEAAIPARLPEHLRAIDGVGQDDRADRIVEVQVIAANEPHDVGGQRLRRQRPGGHDHRIALGSTRESCRPLRDRS